MTIKYFSMKTKCLLMIIKYLLDINQVLFKTSITYSNNIA